MSPRVITKVWQLGNLTLIILIRKNLPNLLVRSKSWLTLILASQTYQASSAWRYSVFLIQNEKWTIFITGHEDRPHYKAFQQSQASPPTKKALIFLRWENLLLESDGEFTRPQVVCFVPTRCIFSDENQTPGSHQDIWKGDLVFPNSTQRPTLMMPWIKKEGCWKTQHLATGLCTMPYK